MRELRAQCSKWRTQLSIGILRQNPTQAHETFLKQCGSVIYGKPQYSRSKASAAHARTDTTPIISSDGSRSSLEHQVTPGKEEHEEHEEQIEKLISSLPLVRHLRSSSSVTEIGAEAPALRETRLHSNKYPDTLARHLVGGSLYGQDKLPIRPLLFMQHHPVSRVLAFFYAGSHLCGHPGYVHGGLPFILFDDVFALCAGMIFKSGVAMTANMSMNYRRPLLPGRICVMRAEVAKHEGRKVWVSGSIRSLEPFNVEDMAARNDIPVDELSVEEESADVVVEAEALFVEPKFADSMVSLLEKH